MSNTADLVARHYNERQQIDVRQRKESPIFQLKAFNNWMKTCLLGRFIRSNDSVLDLCCGKGGDLQKYSYLRIKRLVGVDIAATSIQHANERLKQRRQPFECIFHVGDCFQDDINDLIGASVVGQFDVVSIQFALHYAFESKLKLERLLYNVCKSLRSGGYFIGTMADGNQILKRLTELPEEDLAFGNDVYQVEFSKRPQLKPGDGTEADTRKIFGRQYRFRLTDAIDDCPEYLSDRQTLEQMAAERGLQLVFFCGFHEFYIHQIRSQNNQETWQRMRVLPTDDGSLIFPADQWEAIGLYAVFAFQLATA